MHMGNNLIKILNSRLVFFALCLLFLSACLRLNSENQIDELEREYLSQTEEYGFLATSILEEFSASWTEKNVEVIGVRVLFYNQDEKIKFIGCTQEQGILAYQNSSEVEYDTEFRRLYVFRYNYDTWELQSVFFMGFDINQTYQDWWYLDQEEKDIIGELPDSKYWDCFYNLEDRFEN